MLRIAADALRQRRGLISVAEYRRRAAQDPIAVLTDTLSDADEVTGSVLAIASVLAPAPIPAQLVDKALARRHGWAYEHARDVLINAFDFLSRRCVASLQGEAVFIHPLAFRVLSRDDADAARPAAAAALAESLAPHTPYPELDAHVRHLASAEGLADADARSGDHLSAGRNKLITGPPPIDGRGPRRRLPGG